MRLITRSDFDGLACAVLLVEAGIVDTYEFVHPKDLQDGLIAVTDNDVLANVPFVPGCGLWFDHHASERERLQLMEEHAYQGSSEIMPSCARVIYNYYADQYDFTRFDDNGMMAAVDKCDSGQFTLDDVRNPAGWVLLSFVMDPRTGLGYHKDYRISNYALMKDLIQYCRVFEALHILQLPDIQERVDRYFAQEDAYEAMIRQVARTEDNVLIIDLTDVDQIKVGNRFKEYALFPEQNISLRVFWARGKEKVTFACGHSILNRTSQTNVGQLMLEYGGGGHTRVGTCQIAAAEWPRVQDELIAAMRENLVPTP